MEAIALPSSLHQQFTRPEQSLQIHDDLKPQVIKKLEDLIKYTLQSHWNSAPQGSTYALELLTKSLQDLQAHFTILTGILNAKTTEEITVVYSKNKVISKMYTKITEASLVSLVPLNDALDHVIKMTFEELKEISCNLSNHKNSDRMKISAYKLATIAEYLPGLVQIATDDIFFYPRSSSVWEKLHQHTEYKHFKNKNAVLRSIHKFSLKLTLANAIIYQNSKKRNEFVGTLSGLSSVGNHKKTQMMSSLYLSNPSMDTAFKVWNLPDRKGFKEFYKLRLPWIDYDKKIYIPRLFSHITRESVLKEYQDGSLQKIKEDGSPMKPVELSEHKDGVVKSLFIPDSKRIKIRILSSKPLKIRHPKLEKVGETFYKLRQKLKAKFFSHDIDGVIIHIHGGGFVSMSSSMHRNYLIRWAKAMNVVIFSIDYRLAPEHPYPAAIEDVWQAYNWLTHYSESILGIPMHNIVVAGDSAGGNLAASLALRTIREGARIPDGLLLSYPALNLFPFKFVPSYLQAISDVFLPANLLKLCLKAYIPEEFRPESDPFLSPAIASDELLSKMPPVRMISGTLDPLHDDVWTFAERLLKLEKDVKVTLFEDLPHGFLSLDEILEYDVVVSTAAEKLNELFGMAKDAKGNLLNQSKIMIKEMVGFS